MFKQNDDQPMQEIDHPETIIGPSMKVEGNFEGQGDVIVDGEVKGTLKTKQNLRVGESAVIDASVEAVNAHVSGTITGNIKVAERLELDETANISGDIEAQILEVSAGAQINGNITMGAHEKTPAQTRTDKTSNDESSSDDDE